MAQELSLLPVFDEQEERYSLEKFDDILDFFKQQVKKYKDLVVLESDVANAKLDRAYLNKKKKEINELKTDTIKRATILFKSQCEEIVGVIDEAVANIDTQIKDFEAKEKIEKKEKIVEIYKTKDAQFELEKLWNDKWLNKTYKLETIESEIDKAIKDFVEAKETLYSMCKGNAEWEIALKVLIETLSLPQAITELTKARELAEKFNNQKVIGKAEVVDEQLYTISFSVVATKRQIDLLSNFMNKNNIQYKQIKNGGN